MRKYLIDFSFKTLDEFESQKYYANNILEMRKMKKNISKYLKIEKKYIDFFLELFDMNNKKVEVKFKNFSFYANEYLFDVEKKEFENFFRTLSFEEIFFKEKIEIIDNNYFKMLIKITYRDYLETKNLSMYFEKLKIEINSIGDYLYTIKLNQKMKYSISEILKKNKLYLKEL